MCWYLANSSFNLLTFVVIIIPTIATNKIATNNITLSPVCGLLPVGLLVSIFSSFESVSVSVPIPVSVSVFSVLLFSCSPPSGITGVPSNTLEFSSHCA